MRHGFPYNMACCSTGLACVTAIFFCYLVSLPTVYTDTTVNEIMTQHAVNVINDINASKTETASQLKTPITITDAANQTLVFDSHPQRIAIIGRGPFMTIHTLYMFEEARDRLVGYENRSTEVKNFLGLLDSRAHTKTELGTNPGIEQILSLRPDLVIKKAWSSDKTAQMLNQTGVPVMHVGLETPEQFFYDMRNIGRILGNTHRAEQIIRFYQDRLERFDERLKDIPEHERPRILVLHLDGRSSSAAMRVPPEEWMQTIQTERAGGRPVWLDESLSSTGWNFVNFEQIAAWNPDKIFVITQQSADTETIIRDLQNNTLWRRLKAAQTGNLLAFPSDMIGWDSPEPRWILGMTWMALHTHPDLFGDLNLDDEIHAFFTFLYGIETSVIDAHIRPGIAFPSGNPNHDGA
jgi:iron complex transport system substrate-binding protein